MNKKEKSKIIFLSGIITLLIILCIYALNGFAPFGTKTLAVMDANIQYIDFFSYLKDVIAGKNSISDSNVIMSQCIQVDNVPIGTLSTCRVKL